MKQFAKSILLRLKCLLGLELSISPELKITNAFIGDQNAGWTIHPNLITEKSVVYAFGIGENISFDLEMINRFNCQVHAFDPTPKSIEWLQKQETPEKFQSYNFGIADYDGMVTFYSPQNSEHVSHTMVDRNHDTETLNVQVKKMSTILRELGHSKIDVLKMDIEGAEYPVIDNLILEGIEVSQLLIEFHHRFKEIPIQKSRNAIERLHNAGYKLFHVSASREEYSFIKI